MVWEASLRDRLGVPSMGATNASGPGASAPAAMVAAATPAGWEELPAKPERFRNAVWRVAGAPDTDCYLTIGVGGGVAFNLRRWYVDQFGKAAAPPVTELPEIDFCDRKGRLVELTGAMGQKQDWAALIAFLHDGDQVTSLKFTGPQAVVAAQRDAFLSLAASIRLGAGPAGGSAGGDGARKPPPVDPSQPLPAGHAPVGQQAPQQSPFTATAPAGWNVKSDSRRFLHHTFGRNSELYVSQLGAAGGGMKQTLEIWALELGQQLSQEAFDALPKVAFLGDDAVLLDLQGEWNGMTGARIDDARVLVAARLDGGTITFCKLVGPNDEVSAQRDQFLQFCASVRRAK